MDGLMCEDIRIGILIRTEMENAGRGGSWRAKIPGAVGYYGFTSTVLQEAGGIRNFLENWEFVPDKPVQSRG